MKCPRCNHSAAAYKFISLPNSKCPSCGGRFRNIYSRKYWFVAFIPLALAFSALNFIPVYNFYGLDIPQAGRYLVLGLNVFWVMYCADKYGKLEEIEK